MVVVELKQKLIGKINQTENSGILEEMYRLIVNEETEGKHPLIGKRTDIENVRVKVIRDYLIIYELTVSNIIVLSIWDCRQKPEDLKRIIQ